MELIVKSLITALLVGALGLVIYVQHNSLKEAKERIERAEQATRDRDGIIKTLTTVADRNRKAAIKLQGDRDNIAVTLTERENLIERVVVKRGAAGRLDVRHLAEPLPTPAYTDDFWTLYAGDSLIAEWHAPK